MDLRTPASRRAADEALDAEMAAISAEIKADAEAHDGLTVSQRKPSRSWQYQNSNISGGM